MRFVLAIGAALAVAFPAAAAEPFDSFRSFCLETQGKTEAAVAVALGQGWTSAPDDVSKAFQKGEHLGFQRPRVVLREPASSAKEARGLALLLAEMGSPLPGVAGYGGACALMDLDGVSGNSTAEVQQWIGFAPAKGGDEDPVWIYSLQDGAPKSETELSKLSNEDVMSALVERPIYVLGAMSGKPSGLLLIALPYTKP